VCSLGLVVLLGTVVSLAGNPPEKSVGNKKTVTEKKAAKHAGVLPVHRTGVEAIEAALNKPIDCSFVDTPLKDVIDYLKDSVQIEIVFDDLGLKEAGIDPDTRITCNIHGRRFETVLNRVVNSAKAKWTIHDDDLFVTSPAKLEDDEFLESRLYDVADLVVFQDQDGKKFDDFAPLSDVITNIIDTKSWVDNGGSGTISGVWLGTAKFLVVTNRYDIQKKIPALLAEIRTIAAKKSGGDGLPCRERPKAAKTAAPAQK